MLVTASPEVLLTILALLIIGILLILVWLVNYIAGPSAKKKSKGKRPNVQFALESSLLFNIFVFRLTLLV